MIDWFLSDLSTWLAIAFSVAAMIAVLVGLNRFFGLRSFSKMSGFDFAITVAFGSVLAGTVIAKDPPVSQGIAAFVFLFLIQGALAFARRHWWWFGSLINNEPRLVWREGEFIAENMKAAQITRSDVYAKMREANAIRLDDVLAVVVETTGDVSVLHKTGDDRSIDDIVMEGVKGWKTQ